MSNRAWGEMVERRSDRELRAKILKELEREGLGGLRLGVQDGRVTLAGTVDSYAKKLAARAAAHRGAGVPELTDNIQVRLPGSAARTDRELADAVGRALEFDEFVPDRKIHFSVARGKVTLEGEVETLGEREDAARVVRHLTGVAGIDNRIRVKGTPAQASPRRRFENRT
ncbi:MAG TPA: BON domain-containing protein [Thermoanaerobaculia bacterium]|nr:BON domain-containing protein [Thermoanaerobaculia bacterium]